MYGVVVDFALRATVALVLLNADTSLPEWESRWLSAGRRAGQKDSRVVGKSNLENDFTSPRARLASVAVPSNGRPELDRPFDFEHHFSQVTWLILPVVICLSQRLSHACPSTSLIKVKPRMAH